jgi:hypothetical protein
MDFDSSLLSEKEGVDSQHGAEGHYGHDDDNNDDEEHYDSDEEHYDDDHEHQYDDDDEDEEQYEDVDLEGRSYHDEHDDDDDDYHDDDHDDDHDDLLHVDEYEADDVEIDGEFQRPFINHEYDDEEFFDEGDLVSQKKRRHITDDPMGGYKYLLAFIGFGLFALVLGSLVFAIIYRIKRGGDSSAFVLTDLPSLAPSISPSMLTVKSPTAVAVELASSPAATVSPSVTISPTGTLHLFFVCCKINRETRFSFLYCDMCRR